MLLKTCKQEIESCNNNLTLIFEGPDLFSQCANRDTGQFRGRHVYGLSLYLELRIEMFYRLTLCRYTYKGRHNTCRNRVEEVGLKIEKIRDILLCMFVWVFVYIKLCH